MDNKISNYDMYYMRKFKRKPNKTYFVDINYKEYFNDYKILKENLLSQNIDSKKKGWRDDIDNAPVNTFLLLRALDKSNRIYRATLVRNKRGEIERGDSDSPWIAEDNEMFCRDAIKEWFNPNDDIKYIQEIEKAEIMQEQPFRICSRFYPDKNIERIIYSDGMESEIKTTKQI